MVIRDNGLAVIINEFSNREIEWIYGQFEWGDNLNFVSTGEKRARIEKYMHQNNKQYVEINNLRLQSQSFLLTNDELQWIENTDIRFLSWLKSRYSTYQHPNQAPRDPGPLLSVSMRALPDNLFHDAFIFQVDNWSVDLQRKRDFLQSIKSDWYNQQQIDRKLAWIDGVNTEQLEWIWGYLKQNLMHGLQDSNFSPTDSEETYSGIFALFYAWAGHPAELREIQGKMKQAWAQQKYRKSLNGRKQSTYVLSTNTKSQLQQLAKARNVNLNQMLEYLIDTAFTQAKEDSRKKR